MRPKRMVVLCNETLELLDMLEGVLLQQPTAGEQFYSYIRLARELNHLPLKDTTARLTREQIQHINSLILAVDELVDTWPSGKFY